jgi:argininosuccinate synthase
LELIMDLVELQERRVGMLMSGGLSCTAVGLWLAENGVDTISYVADIGQHYPFTATELAEVLDRQGLKTQVVDLRARMAEFYMHLLRYQATYEGAYWNTTSGSRAALVSGLAEPLRAAGCTVLAHGCVGGGNDQGRFARYTAAVAPDLTVFTPWTHDWLLERFPNRQSMTDFLADRGVHGALLGFTDYSVDGNLGGWSHDGGDLESLTTPVRVVDPLMTTWPEAAPDKAEPFRVRFVAAQPVEINGRPVSALSGLLLANQIGGRNGVPMRSLVENRVNGTKCRGVYEAPGLDSLGHCLAALYQVTLDRATSDLMHALSRQIGRAVYEGRWYDPATLAARAAADALAVNATGTVEAEIYKGNIIVNNLSAVGEVPGVARQTRFGQGGHFWQVPAYGTLA